MGEQKVLKPDIVSDDSESISTINENEIIARKKKIFEALEKTKKNKKLVERIVLRSMVGGKPLVLQIENGELKYIIDRTQYRKVKKDVHVLEEKNYNKLYVYLSTNGWWRVGGNSAYILKYLIGPKLERYFKMTEDSDNYNIFYDGVISIPDYSKFKVELADIGIKKHVFENGYSTFTLNFSIKKEELEILKHERLNKVRSINNTLSVNDPMPEFHYCIKKLLPMYRRAYKNMDHVDRQFVGDVIGHYKKYLGDSRYF